MGCCCCKKEEATEPKGSKSPVSGKDASEALVQGDCSDLGTQLSSLRSGSESEGGVSASASADSTDSALSSSSADDSRVLSGRRGPAALPASWHPLPAPVGRHSEVREFRVAVPLTSAEFEKAYLHVVTEGSKRETGGGGGVEVTQQRRFRRGEPGLPPDFAATDGHYTHKIYHIRHHAPRWLKPLMHSFHFEAVHEDSWTAYPYSRTMIYNPKWSQDDFLITISSLVVEGDTGALHNALKLPAQQLKVRQVLHISITDDGVLGKTAYDAKMDPKRWRSADGKRGPFRPAWERLPGPRLCAYKVVTVTIHWRLLESKARAYLLKTFYPQSLARIHREAVCTYDHWSRCSLLELEAADANAQKELNRLRLSTAFTGTAPVH